ncbi:MAG: hypothetical protein HY000_14900 [Planctomycetes bacterium]|nr:hypothetical protein [Planctomycetota bacterium]
MNSTSAVILTLLICSNTVADEALRQRFLTEYPNAEWRLRHRYATLKIVYESTYTRQEEHKNLPTGAKVVYLANQGNFRVDREQIGGKQREIVSGFVLGPEGRLIVDRNVGARQFHIRRVDAPMPGREPEFMSFIAGVAPIAFAPFSCFSQPIINLLDKPGFSIEDATSTDGDSGLVAVKWKWKLGELPPGSVKEWEGEWVFDPSRSWALVSCRFRRQLPDGTWAKEEAVDEMHFEGAIDDVPLVKRFVYSSKNVETGEILDQELDTVTEIEPCEATADQFTRVAYGVGFEQDVPQNRTPKWLVILGWIWLGLSLLAAVELLVRSILKRRQAPT